MNTITFNVATLSSAGLKAFIDYAELCEAKVVQEEYSLPELVFCQLGIPFHKGSYSGRNILVGGLKYEGAGDSFNYALMCTQIHRLNALLLEKGFQVRLTHLDPDVLDHLNDEGLSNTFTNWVNPLVYPNDRILHRCEPGVLMQSTSDQSLSRETVILVCIEPIDE